ncbi:MAG: CDP-glucose 4,6-dehydratase [Pseudomonadota bacterium]
MEGLAMNPSFWKNKRVLITGHTGFKGAWLSLWLERLGAEVHGVSLPPKDSPNLFEKASIHSVLSHHCLDIRNREQLGQLLTRIQPEIVFHLAAQSLVRYSYENPLETYETNVIGTLNVLEAVRAAGSVRQAIIITTDKVYENHERDAGYKEHEPLGGHDPYSSSKACAELLVSSYRRSFFPDSLFDQHKMSIASVRAGNVIGGGDWAKDRLIPDFVRAIESGSDIVIRNPSAVRPWQHVLDALSGYLALTEAMSTQPGFAGAWNFGPAENDARPVRWIVEKMISLSGKQVSWSQDGGEHPHEAGYLRLDCRKANEELDWQPTWSLDSALEKVVEWHLADASGRDARETSIKQIEDYMNA